MIVWFFSPHESQPRRRMKLTYLTYHVLFSLQSTKTAHKYSRFLSISRAKKPHHIQTAFFSTPSSQSKMTEYHEPTVAEATALFRSIEEKFPSKTLGEDKWYLVAVGMQFYIALNLVNQTRPRLFWAWNPIMLELSIPTSLRSPNTRLPNLEKPLFAVCGKPWSRISQSKESASRSKELLP